MEKEISIGLENIYSFWLLVPSTITHDAVNWSVLIYCLWIISSFVWFKLSRSRTHFHMETHSSEIYLKCNFITAQRATYLMQHSGSPSRWAPVSKVLFLIFKVYKEFFPFVSSGYLSTHRSFLIGVVLSTKKQMLLDLF